MIHGRNVYIRGHLRFSGLETKLERKGWNSLELGFCVKEWYEAIIMNLNLDWAPLTWWLLRGYDPAKGLSIIVRVCTMSLHIVEVQRNIVCDLWFAGGLFWLEHQGNDWQLGLSPSLTHTFTHATLMHHMRLHIHTFSQANSEIHYLALILSINSFISFFSPSMSSGRHLPVVYHLLSVMSGMCFKLAPPPLPISLFFLSYCHIFPIFQPLLSTNMLNNHTVEALNTRAWMSSMCWASSGMYWGIQSPTAVNTVYSKHTDSMPVNIINHSLVLALWVSHVEVISVA